MMELAEMFPTDEAARKWFEAKVWTSGRHCPRCGYMRTSEASHAKMPYWCSDCRFYFSVKTGSVMEDSPLPLRKWVWAIYLHLTSLKGVSSMKLHRDIGVTQKTAWFMLQRIRKAFDRNDDGPPFAGPVEFDETYVGGKRKNMLRAKRAALTGRGGAGKVTVAGAKDRATKWVSAAIVPATDGATLQGFVRARAEAGAKVYTDDATAYRGMPEFNHEAVNHSVGEYVRGMAHTNGIESFWAMLKRGYQGTYHHMSSKHLHRYIAEFSGRHNIRNARTLNQMVELAYNMTSKRLTYQTLIAGNGLSGGELR